MKDANNILFIDDDFATNFIHKKLISKIFPSIKIQIAHSGLEALDLLTQTNNEIFIPDMILLDINMPIMNGWEFLEEYEKLNSKWIEDCVLFMVSASINPDDETLSKTHPRVNGFIKKPLTKEIVTDIFEKYCLLQVS